MTKLENLEQQIYDEGIPVLSADFDELHLDALYFDGNIFMSRKVKNTAEKRCLLVEEYCHYLYNFGNILRDQKQEAIARRKSYEMLVPLRDLKMACNDGCRNLYECAEFLNVTEDVLTEALEYYIGKGAI